jgi:hypothetical protein
MAQLWAACTYEKSSDRMSQLTYHLSQSAPMKIKDFDVLKNSRLAMGLSLFLIAALAATLIAKEANRTVYVWASTSELAPGNLITESDIKATSVLLLDSAKNYLSASAQIIGSVVQHRISTGDLIPIAAIAASVPGQEQLELRAVPLTIESTDLPMGLSRGEIVDIYAIPTSGQGSITESILISDGITVSAVAERNNSGKASVVVSLPQSLVLTVLTHLSNSRLIIVRSNY